MALVPPLGLPADQVRSLLEPLRNRLSVAVCNSENAFSVGAIIRVAHNFLVREIVVIGSGRWYEKASMGMEHFENVIALPDEAAFFRHASQRPIWSVEKDHATTGLYEVTAYPEDVILVFGSERSGVPASILCRSAAVIGIPIYGVNHSLPVAVAAGIVLSDFARRRYAPGTVIAGPPRRAGRTE
jgi:tRNA G18 (ribose-2'-O)-methylase SpoU